jgi:NADH:ubiquinone oxidoreductase subunit 4 (subunit M)
MLRAVRAIFHGEPGANVSNLKDLSGAPLVPFILLSAGLVALGVFPGLVLKIAGPVLRGLTGGG